MLRSFIKFDFFNISVNFLCLYLFLAFTHNSICSFLTLIFFFFFFLCCSFFTSSHTPPTHTHTLILTTGCPHDNLYSVLNGTYSQKATKMTTIFRMHILSPIGNCRQQVLLSLISFSIQNTGYQENPFVTKFIGRNFLGKESVTKRSHSNRQKITKD